MKQKNDKLEVTEATVNSNNNNSAMMEAMPKALVGKGFDSIKEMLLENLGGNAQLGFSDLTRITMPAGGGSSWEIPSASGKPKITETFTGVVVAFQDVKVYWEKSVEDSVGNTPPDCRSLDCVKGIGNPGVYCDTCAFNQFGSGTNGIGKACNDKRLLYVLSDDSLLPKVLSVPATSIAVVRKSFLSLAMEDTLFYSDVLFEFGLEKGVSIGGKKYSKLTLQKVGELEDELKSRASEYKTMMKKMINQVSSSIIESVPSHAAESL